jgi:predicted nucleic acid-binding Zn ribbon protein
MTDITPVPSRPSSGVDLARVALQNARAAAKSQPQPQRRTGASASRAARTSGRDPLPFATALSRMIAERGWDVATRGGSVIDQWPAIAPELAGKIAAVAFDDRTRTLRLRPVSPAYRTQVELYQRQILAKINAATGQDTVRHLYILAPGTVDTPTTEPPREHSPDRGRHRPTLPGRSATDPGNRVGRLPPGPSRIPRSQGRASG